MSPANRRCERALEALSARMDGELTPLESTALDAHLASCPGCAAVESTYEDQNRRARLRLAGAIPDLRGPILTRALRPLALRRELPRLLVGAAVALAAFCGALVLIDRDAAPAVEVAEGMVIPAGPGQDTAVYLTLVNHGGGDELTGVNAEVAERAVLHSHDTRSGRIVMAGSGPHPVQARAATTLAPGTQHVMLEGLHHQLEPGDEVVITLQFADSPETTTTVEVVGPVPPGRPSI